MSERSARERWSPDDLSAHDPAVSGLAGDLVHLAGDRTSTAREIVRAASRVVLEWLTERAPLATSAGNGVQSVWTYAAASRDLEHGLRALVASQGWRGPVAVWVDALRRTLAEVGEPEHPAHTRGPRRVLTEELSHWLAPDDAARTEWDGAPLTAGPRLASREAVAREASREMEPGEVVVVLGDSEIAALALRAAATRGLMPSVVIGSGAGDLAGRRLATRLLGENVDVRLVHDAALTSYLPQADRLWIPTEGIGGEAMIARVGTRTLVEEAGRLEVPVEVLATSDMLLPGGQVELPTWCAHAPALLWPDAPPQVELSTQLFELLPLSLANVFVTEAGRESAAELAVRSLRTEPMTSPR